MCSSSLSPPPARALVFYKIARSTNHLEDAVGQPVVAAHVQAPQRARLVLLRRRNGTRGRKHGRAKQNQKQSQTKSTQKLSDETGACRIRGVCARVQQKGDGGCTTRIPWGASQGGAFFILRTEPRGQNTQDADATGKARQGAIRCSPPRSGRRFLESTLRPALPS